MYRGKVVALVCPIVLFSLLICSTAVSASSIRASGVAHEQRLHPRQNSTQGDDGTLLNSQDIYGLGVRLGSYFQAFAFVLGFVDFEETDPKTQFSGVILAFGLLIRWWTRKNNLLISASELWIALAQLLAITTPGLLLQFLGFSYQRTSWRDRNDNKILRKEMVRGQGFNFIQAAVILFWANVTNSVFSYWIIGSGKDEPFEGVVVKENPIWMLVQGNAESQWMKIFMIVQAIITTLVEILPFLFYFIAWIESVYDYWGYKKYQALDNQEWTSFAWRDRIKFSSRRTWLLMPAAICGVLAFFYVMMLIFSVELTIRAAKLHPTNDMKNPGQLLPLITGCVSLANAATHLRVWTQMVEIPERVERFANGDEKVYRHRVHFERRRVMGGGGGHRQWGGYALS